MTVNPTESSGNTIQSARWNVILQKLQGIQSGAVDRDVIMTGIYERDAIQSAALLNYWKFDEEDTATAYDYGTGADNLTGTSISTFGDGVLKSAVDLDGTNDWWETDDLTPWATDEIGTISMWVNCEDLAQNALLTVGRLADATNTHFFWDFDTRANQGIYAQLYVDGTAQWVMQEDVDTGLTEGGCGHQGDLNKWVHLVMTHDGVRPRLYVNGKQRGILTTTTDTTKWFKAIITDATNKADRLTIGALAQNSNHVSAFNGKVDEVMYWSGVALSPNEVTRLFNSYSKDSASFNQINIKGFQSNEPRFSIQANHLRNYWGFDEADTITAYDNVGYSNLTGTSIDGQAFVNGVIGKAVDLDGSADYFETTELTPWDNDTTGTISIWFNQDAFSGNDTLFAINDKDGNQVTTFYIRINDTGAVRMILVADSTTQWYGQTTSTELADLMVGKWNNIIVTHDGVKPRMYINGIEPLFNMTTTTDLTKWFKAIITDATTKADNLTIGAWHNNGGYSNYFDGKIDEVMYWNTALTKEEVWKLYASYKPEIELMKINICAGITGGWCFNEYTSAAITEAYDYSGISNTLTHVHAPATAQGKFGAAVHYDGANDYSYTAVVTPWANDTQGTVSLWVNLDDDPAGGGNEAMFVISDFDTNTQTFMYIRFNDANETVEVNLKIDNTDQWNITAPAGANFVDFVGIWKHICVVQNGIAPLIYIDGVEQTTEVTTTNLTKWFKALITDATNKASHMYLGVFGNNSGYINYYDGKIDNVSIHNRPLCAEEVMLLYQGVGSK